MLDFETSGMSPEAGERVTEVAALRIVGGEVVARYVSLINCGVWISPFITQLTGITQAMVDRAPRSEKVIPELLEFIGNDFLAAHNASFDEKFLLAEARRLQLPAQHAGLLCSVKLARRVFPGHASYSLGQIAAALGIRFRGNAHRAEADAEVAAHLLLRIGQQLMQAYQFTQVGPELLLAINRLTAAKVGPYLEKMRYAGLAGPN